MTSHIFVPEDPNKTIPAKPPGVWSYIDGKGDRAMVDRMAQLLRDNPLVLVNGGAVVKDAEEGGNAG